MNRLQAAEQLRRALQIFSYSLADEQVIEVPAIYDPWVVNKSYSAGEIFTYGENSVGDPQLYKVIQAHSSQADWTPDVSVSLYSAIGLDNGYPVWSSPAGAHDAYNIGDIVSHNGMLYISEIDGNTTMPGEDVRWWSVYTE